jgi:Leucine-rich repeat (LRR) protein
LTINDTSIADLSPLVETPNLYWLNAARTRISDLGALDSHPRLTFLDLSGNRISNIRALGSIPGLLWAALGGTDVADPQQIALLAQILAETDSAYPNRGLELADTPLSRKPPYDVLTALPQPAATVETIVYARHAAGLTSELPLEYVRPSGFLAPDPAQFHVPYQD